MGMEYSASKRSLLAIVITVIAILIAALGFVVFTYKIKGKLETMRGKTEYQAVFLTNGQVYFGKLKNYGEWSTLTNVYYLQVNESQPEGNPAQDPAAIQNSTDINLVKLGSELHGPTDAMQIPTRNILFWEDMKDDSKVVQTIKQGSNR